MGNVHQVQFSSFHFTQLRWRKPKYFTFSHWKFKYIINGSLMLLLPIVTAVETAHPQSLSFNFLFRLLNCPICNFFSSVSIEMISFSLTSNARSLLSFKTFVLLPARRLIVSAHLVAASARIAPPLVETKPYNLAFSYIWIFFSFGGNSFFCVIGCSGSGFNFW